MTNLRNNGFRRPMKSVATKVLPRGMFSMTMAAFPASIISRKRKKAAIEAKMIGGALVVALLLGGAGIYMFSGGTSMPQTTAAMPAKAPAQMASNAPAPAPVAAPAAPTDTATPTASPYDAAPAAAPTAPTTDAAATDTKPVKSAKVIHKESKQGEAKLDADSRLRPPP